MIERQSIIDAIQDLQEAITHGDDFHAALPEIADEYKVPAKVIVANIERIEPVDSFISRFAATRVQNSEFEEKLLPLKQHLDTIYSRERVSDTVFLATRMFVQKQYPRELWPAALSFERRYSRTLRLKRNFKRDPNAPDQ